MGKGQTKGRKGHKGKARPAGNKGRAHTEEAWRHAQQVNARRKAEGKDARSTASISRSQRRAQQHETLATTGRRKALTNFGDTSRQRCYGSRHLGHHSSLFAVSSLSCCSGGLPVTGSSFCMRFWRNPASKTSISEAAGKASRKADVVSSQKRTSWESS